MHVETIRVQDGKVRNIRYHNKRYKATLKAIYGIDSNRNLRSMITVPDQYKTGRVKCRILYDDSTSVVSFEQYNVKPIKAVKLLNSDISYTYKSADRDALHDLYEKKGVCDDIIMVIDGLLTDTYYANIALRSKGRWYTPRMPLLEGTMRAKLLEKGRIHTAEISPDDLHHYDKLRIFNAMIPFGEVEFSTASIHK